MTVRFTMPTPTLTATVVQGARDNRLVVHGSGKRIPRLRADRREAGSWKRGGRGGAARLPKEARGKR